MKRLLMPALLMASLSLHAADKLTSYQEVDNHFKAGNSLKLLVNLGWCEGAELKGAGIDFTVDANPVMKVNSDYKFSTTHYTRNNPKHRGLSVIEHIRYILSNDDRIHITAHTLDANTHQLLDPELNFVCELGVSAAFYSH